MAETPLKIRSYRGEYEVLVETRPFAGLENYDPATTHFFVDGRVAQLYGPELTHALKAPSCTLITADENHKSFEAIPGHIQKLLTHQVRRTHTLLAIGGGITQDIVCFLSSVLFRGMKWDFYPTTLLAQADSCIGSKSSINFAGIKNLVGTFHAPRRVIISPAVLKTLASADIRSGIGEMIKVHVIDGHQSFAAIQNDYPRLLNDSATMARYIRRSLEIKKGIIEQDEFDAGIRNIMNYGHSFGHAIEAATDFAVPHGIAVAIGMDMAGFVSRSLGHLAPARQESMHHLFKACYGEFGQVPVPQDRFFDAISKDKKNENASLTLILPLETGSVKKMQVPLDDSFRALCSDYFKSSLN